MNYTDRVAKGAATLDEILPGWERKIDLEHLYLESACDCVLGQLAVDLLPHSPGDPYEEAVEELSPWVEFERQARWAELRGFALGLAPGNKDYDDEAAAWYDLTEAWKRLIRQRLEA